ncbi:MAG: PilN domain-containing protein [Bacteroidota bacterium]
MKRFFNSIDIQKLAGITRMLGVDLTESHVRVVELEKVWSSIKKLSPKLRVINSFSHEFSASDKNKAQTLSNLLHEKGIKTKRAVSSIQSLGVKVVSATIPQGTENVLEWIEEHLDQLLKIPVARRDISFDYEILSSTDSESNAEISFVRNTEIEATTSFFHDCGLELIALGAGGRDAVNSFLLQNGNKAPSHTGDNAASETGNENGPISKPSDINVIYPLGLPSDYALATGLAIKGFVPELSSTNFLSGKEKEEFHSFIYKSLFQRSILAFGTLLFVTLLILALLQSQIESRIALLDEQILASGSDYTAVAVLERQVKELERSFADKGKTTNIAKALHDIAQDIPEGVWLYRFKLEKPPTFLISGYTKESDKVTDFLRNLGKDFTDVSLIRSGDQPQSGVALPAQKGFITFELKALRGN